jgi:Zn-dependent M28 family amino/carboxypeptidase
VEGELVDLGYGLPEEFDRDLSDAVVMVDSNVPDWYDRYIHRTEKYHRAVDAGADAFVYSNHVEGCLPPTGSVRSTDGPVGEIPAVGVSKEVGARLTRRFEGEPVTVDVDCDLHDAESANLHAELGPDTDREVLVTSHVDAHDIAEGAGDNGAGTAVLVEIARALSAREADLDARVHFVAFGAEEVGLVGSNRLADGYDLDSVKAVLNNDGVVRGRTLSLYTHGFDELEAAADRMAGRFDHPVDCIPKMSPHSDHWPFVNCGVPGFHAVSETDQEGRGWGHTYADTLDKVDSRNLREQAILLTDLVVELADREVTLEREDPGTIAAALEDQNLARGMKITGDWPYDS